MESDWTVCVLGSGSKGNCIYARAGSTEFLVDAGLRCEALESRLAAIGVHPRRIRHVFITHEHADHIDGLRVFSRKYGPRVHVSRGTYLHVGSLVPRPAEVHVFDGPYDLDGIEVHPFPVSHDAVDPVGFSFVSCGKRVTVATDMGFVGASALAHLKDSDVVILECNHDSERLMQGPYPFILKKRIAGPTGHLSNRQAADALVQIANGRLKYICLAHLSQENNTPHLALSALQGLELTPNGEGGPVLVLTHQDRCSEVLHF